MGESIITALKTPDDLRRRQAALRAKTITDLAESPMVVGGVVKGGVEDSEIEAMAGKWQLIELRFEDRKSRGIVARGKQPVSGIAKNIDGDKPVASQRQPIGHPAISGAEIEDL